MAKFELYKSPNGEYRWRLRATNGQVIATGGEGYFSKAAAQNGIESVKRAAADASSKRFDNQLGPSGPSSGGSSCW
jgi:uncharacterized protein YegP (UPF0339 family)